MAPLDSLPCRVLRFTESLFLGGSQPIAVCKEDSAPAKADKRAASGYH